MAGLFKRRKEDQPQFFATVGEGLKKIYKAKLLPLEEAYDFHDFVSPQLNDPDFDAKPMILFVGQYSTGKTSLIRYLLERDYPGLRIGPEPTTDNFTAVMYGETEQIIPGNALAVDNKKQFRPLTKFGGAFLNRFQCSTLKNPVLKCVTMIDSPGILSGEKQRVDRGYDFVGVLQWFAERVDRIILLFDANKLDISDEFRRSIEAIHGYEDKVRIILNKADQVDHQELMRVYGALMWSISKVVGVPECPKVFIGSFWDQQLKHDLYRRLFEKELQCLFDDLQDLPKYAALRKLNDFIKRARMAKIHAFIISELRSDMPKFFGKGRKQKELIKNLPILFKKVQEQHLVSASDIPPVDAMQEKLRHCDFRKFPLLKEKLVAQVDTMLDQDIADLMSIVPQDSEEPGITGGAFDDVKDVISPFGYNRCEGVDLGAGEPDWIVTKERSKWDAIFEELSPVKGKITGSVAKKEMIKSRLPNPVLAKVWRLADVDADGMLDSDEFALAVHLINVKLEGYDLPDDLPDHLVPPSKKSVVTNERASIILDFKSKNGPVVQKTTQTATLPKETKNAGKKIPPEFMKPEASPVQSSTSQSPRSTTSQKEISLEEREAKISEDITKNLETIGKLVTEHMSEKGLLSSSSDSNPETTSNGSNNNNNNRQHTLHYKAGILRQRTAEKNAHVRAHDEQILATLKKTAADNNANSDNDDIVVGSDSGKSEETLAGTANATTTTMTTKTIVTVKTGNKTLDESSFTAITSTPVKPELEKVSDPKVEERSKVLTKGYSSCDEEIELTFDMTQTKVKASSGLKINSDDELDAASSDTLEDTYARLGVTFLELTSQMQNVMKEVTSTTSEVNGGGGDGDDEMESNDEGAVDTINPQDLPFIDDGAEAELDAAIEAAAPNLNHEDHVTTIQVASPETNGALSVSTLLVSERSCSGTDTIHSTGKVVHREYRDV